MVTRSSPDLQPRPVLWRIWQYILGTLMIASIVLLTVVGESYKARLPLQPQPAQHRTLPITITGTVPIYANPHEKRTWDLLLYCFFLTWGLFFITAATTQYLKGKPKADDGRAKNTPHRGSSR
jgi:hypothetical protein